MGLLVVGFIISALTTRSGVQLTIDSDGLAERARMLSVPPGTTGGANSAVLAAGGLYQVEVLNGCGVPGVANQFTDFLRSRGYDVVRFTNAQRYD